MHGVSPVQVHAQEIPRADGTRLTSFYVDVIDRKGRRCFRRFATREDAQRFATLREIPVSRIREDECSCGAPILKVKTDPHGPGRPRLLDRDELLEPMVCPVCRTARDEFGRKLNPDITCWRCNGARIVGAVPSTWEVFALDGDGRVREYDPQGGREPGETLHRKHRCGRDPAASRQPAPDIAGSLDALPSGWRLLDAA